MRGTAARRQLGLRARVTVAFALGALALSTILSVLTYGLVRNNLVGEGGGQVGLGSAYGVILLALCLGFIIWYLINSFRENET